MLCLNRFPCDLTPFAVNIGQVETFAIDFYNYETKQQRQIWSYKYLVYMRDG